MNATQAKHYLSLLLTIVGCGLMVAFLFVLLPSPQMAAIHDWLGLGEFPDVPLTFYLARSTSLLYGVHGLLMFVVGRKLNKYIELAKLMGWLHVGLGLTMLGIDLSAGMPWWWTAFEGLPIAATGLLVVWLAKKSSVPAAE